MSPGTSDPGGRGTQGPRPPRWIESLLRRVLPGGVRGASILRDLRVEYQGLTRARGRPPRLWYLGQAVDLALHYLAARIRAHTLDRTDLMDRLRQDLVYALRRLRKDPVFAAVAVLTIALGIGANAAIFSVVDAVVLRPLPYDDPDELVVAWEWNMPRDRRENVANPGNYKDWKARAETFEDMAAATFPQPSLLSAPGEPAPVSARYTSGNWFRVLGLDPVLGRHPEAVPESEGAPEVLLSHGFWLRRFGGDPGVVGTSLTLNGTVTTVVGVLPEAYVAFGDEADLFAAIPIRGDQTSTGRYLHVIGRLADGATLERAREEMEAISAGLRESYPDFNGGWSVNLVPLREHVMGDVRTGLLLLLGAVGVLLLIACANVANLFLARASERSREMAVRSSLGAGRARLLGQLGVESLLVAGLGAVLGLAMAYAATGRLAELAAGAFQLPRGEAATLDGRVLLFAAAATGLTALLFGLVPALKAASTRPAQALARQGRGGSARGDGGLRGGLVVFEVALSLVLVAGAALLARSFSELVAVDPGFDADPVMTARVSLTGDAYAEEDAQARFHGELLERIDALPGVEEVGAINFLPFTGLAEASNYVAKDRPAPPREEWPVAEVRNVSGDYFAAMGVGLVAGRLFDERDREESVPVAVVDRALAEAQWSGGAREALGRRVDLSWGPLRELEIVGVVETVRHHGLDATPRGTIYVPYSQKRWASSLVYTVRSEGDPTAVLPGVRRALGELDPGLALSQVRPLEDVVAASVARPRMSAFLVSAFAVLAALLAAVGLYGVLSYAVSRRVREIGVRVAMGALPSSVVGMVLREGLTLVVLGVVLGVGASLAATRLLGGLLFRVEPGDPVSLALAAALLLAVGAVACLVPALRAVRIDPAGALRAE